MINIYEQLKNGTFEGTITTNFFAELHKIRRLVGDSPLVDIDAIYKQQEQIFRDELKNAKARLAAEKNKALDNARSKVIEALTDYLEVFSGDKDIREALPPEYMESVFGELEREMTPVFTAVYLKPKNKSKDNSDELINKFLKRMK